LGASYADARRVTRKTQGISVRNAALERITEGIDDGYGIRVLVDGAWGFAASNVITDEEAIRTAALAVEYAKAAKPFTKHSADIGESAGEAARWRAPMEKDPFKVPIKDKVDLLARASKAAMAVSPKVKLVTANMNFITESKVFVSTEGARIEQEFTESGASVTSTAVGDGDMQVRSYPGSFGGNFAQAGYEFVEAQKLEEGAVKAAEEAVALLTAEQCPSGNMTLILLPEQLALQIHESCGHPVELDRVYGTEAAYAGTSFLTTDKLGKGFKYGSEKVNLYQCSTAPGGLGTYAYDDEGMPSSQTPLVEKGEFVGYLMGREWAGRLGLTSNAAMRADGWSKTPIVRMTNVCLAPGDETLESLIAGTEDGVMMTGIKSWSIDDKRVNFQFGCEIGWRIKGGKVTGIVKNPTYTGSTTEFWGSCDGVAKQEEWVLWGVPNCGKGEPMQVAHVGHGCAPARFRNVKVGVGKW
ncbi:MAG TPA: TldD/PmbA family protein, partial [Bacillota bacterium]|nr:TldD/PmbA family protein [Bacillota bacterium]